MITTIEPFGVERCLFASNFPVERPARAYDALYTAYAEIVAGAYDHERRALFSENAIRIYRLEP